MDQETAAAKLQEINALMASPDAVLLDDDDDGPIQWQLLHLDEESGRALVISTRIVAQMPFSKNNDNNWQNSPIRSWLNGNFFASLPDAVRARVLEVPIHGGKDRVFLLSIGEAEIYFGSNAQGAAKYNLDSNKQRAAKYKGAEVWWWLRSPEGSPGAAAGVDFDGNVLKFGGVVDYDLAGVRPALWLNLGA
jgi:hypothetical protein